MNLPDQPARDRFAREIAQNFSVIAPAGVGKTTAISHRVAQIALADHRALAERRAPRLPRLVVVTYTRKAADELRHRARDEISKARDLPPAIFGLFNEAFFGTIHSFCIELIQRFGPLAGLPARFVIEPDDTSLHLAFQRDTTDAAEFLPKSLHAAWRKFGSEESLWPLVWKWPAGLPPPPAPGPCPELDFSEIINFTPKRKDPRVIRNLELSRERLRRWRAACAAARALGVPEVSGGGEDFINRWNAAFQPLREWLARAAACAAAGLAEKFLQFKERRGVLGYDDLARTALQLLRDPAVAERIRAQEYSVLLDEAQDTDPAQFAVLLGVAQLANAPGLWVEQAGAPPAPGRFSMVGDPQQSIYTRADVKMYLDLHHRLHEAGAVEPLKFSVTLRCDVSVVAHVNARFESVLDASNGQVGFVQLSSRPGAGTGGVWRLPVVRPENISAKPGVEELRRIEAQALARWLAQAKFSGIGADSWQEVAVLAPRRDWLETVALELQAAGLEAQLHTGRRTPGADPARTWLGALLGVLADPGDDFEKIGVLREIFGISDDELYHWRCEKVLSKNLAAALALLAQLTQRLANKPLRDIVALAASASRLPERLALLPEPPAPGALEALLDRAALADARGDTLAAFARSLRRGPAEVTEIAARPGAIQLLTNHKAKGLQWQAVIQFGLFLKPKFANPEYPCWRPAPAAGQPPQSFYDKTHAAVCAAGENSHTRARDAGRRAEFERLLYVATTRPKHTLILLDAESLADKVSDDSLAALLGVVDGGSARTAWKNLDVAPDDGRNFSVEQLGEAITELSGESDKNASCAFKPPSAWSPNIFTTAIARAGDFIHRVRPSTLARHTTEPERDEPDLAAPPEYPEEQPVPGAAVAYGNWWHGLMEHTPWPQGRDAWAKFWEPRLSAAPDVERAHRETSRLLNSPLATRLSAPGLEFAAEVPFLWAEPEGARAFDGCVDLAVWDAKNSRWLVVDWKTDFAEGDYAAELKRRYGPQIQVYARALAAMTGAPADAVLYGTRAGVLTTP